MRTRAAYKSGDREALAAIAEDYTATIKAVEAFEKALLALWLAESKPNGIEVSDLCLGGLILRLANYRDRLLTYLDSTEKSVPELEEELLPYIGHGFTSDQLDMPIPLYWRDIITPNVL